MRKRVALIGLSMAMVAVTAAAQTVVNSSETTATTGNVPYVSAATSTTTTFKPSPISASGSNVGIGTTTPNYLFEFLGSGSQLSFGAATGQGSIYSTSTGAAFGWGSSWNASGLHFSTQVNAAYLLTGYDGSIRFYTDTGLTASTISSPTAYIPTERMRLTPAGYLGIGTPSPTRNFVVSQGTTGPGAITVSASGTTVTGSGTNFTNTFKAGDTITANSETHTVSAIASDTSMTTDAWSNAAASATYSLAGGARFAVSGNGYVGIGTTSPTVPLEVNGSIKLDSGNLIFPDGTNLNSTSLYVNGPSTGLMVSGANLGTYASSGLPLPGSNSNLVLENTGNLLLGWNLSAGGGEQDLMVNRGAGSVGGFRFYDVDNSNKMTALLTLRGDGKVGIGTTTPAQLLEVNGNAQVDGTLTGSSGGAVNVGANGFTFSDSSNQTTAWTGVLCGGDYAEAVDAAGDRKSYQPGDVLVLSTGKESDVEKSAQPYSTMVAGIFATKPGVIGKRQSMTHDTSDIPMAMVGIVPTKVSAENGPIRKGDLLVTSSTPGYAMKGTDRDRMLGAVIGKALGPLNSGSGTIEVLVTLQ